MFLSNHRLLLLGIVVSVALALVKLRRNRKSLYPLPPGPPSEPLIGHLRVIPALNPEHQYIHWSKEYDSDVLHFTVLGRSIIVLNSVEAAHELLDKRGANYADRPRFVLFELMGWGITLTFLRWGPQFKLHRKMLQQAFTPTACKPYRVIQEYEARRVCKQILQKPLDWEILARQFSTAIVMRVGFGVEIQDDNDPYIQMAIDAEEATATGGTPAGSAIDFFPLLRFLPDWLISYAPLRHARTSGYAIQRLHNAPWAAMEPSIRLGQAKWPSFVRTHYENYSQQIKEGSDVEMTLDDIKGAAGTISIAGGNTTWSTIIAEIDSITGGERLPTFDDRAKMPYLERVLEETTRIVPLSPLGVPHASLKDDIYKGMLIPAGSVIYANAQAMTHDPSIYLDPDTFNPDRYVSVDQGGLGEPLPEGPFGFGRRVCPGRHLALAGVFIFMSTMLATFDLKPEVGLDGQEKLPRLLLTNGLSSRPEKFKCSIVVRSDTAAQLLSKF